MKHLLWFAAMISTAAACGGKKSDTPATPATSDACAAAAKNLAAISFLAVKKAHPTVDGAGELAIATEAQTSCTTSQWSAEAAKCYADGKTEAELKTCAKLLTHEQDQAFDKALKKIDFDVAAPAGSAAPAAATASATGVCKDYADAFDKVVACQKLPQDQRDAFKDTRATMAASFAGYAALAAEAQKAMDDSCTQGLATLKQVAPDCGL